jgi:hypothetical protein
MAPFRRSPAIAVTVERQPISQAFFFVSAPVSSIIAVPSGLAV